MCILCAVDQPKAVECLQERHPYHSANDTKGESQLDLTAVVDRLVGLKVEDDIDISEEDQYWRDFLLPEAINEKTKACPEDFIRAMEADPLFMLRPPSVQDDELQKLKSVSSLPLQVRLPPKLTSYSSDTPSLL